ncbi:MAG: TIGR03936 family radical SAM-associated protein [Actinomycetota bacterium]|nr:TIGR03936 family radical SAM-associated protein [Actinomycetota bacterium]
MPGPRAERPRQQPPPVQRLRIRYAKRGRLRFTSHRDISRAFERAVRRSGLPVSYSSGFNPHPRLSYAGAAPTGAASEAEYLEIALAAECDPAQAQAALDAALPPGLDVLDAVPAHPGGLADRLEASRWSIRLPGVSPDAARQAVATFLSAESVQVSRMTKRGLRTFDARGAVRELLAHTDGGFEPPCAILGLVVRHGEPSVRPDDVLAGLREVAGLEATAAPTMCRLAQGPLDPRDGTVGDPLAPDRDTRGR